MEIYIGSLGGSETKWYVVRSWGIITWSCEDETLSGNVAKGGWRGQNRRRSKVSCRHRQKMAWERGYPCFRRQRQSPLQPRWCHQELQVDRGLQGLAFSLSSLVLLWSEHFLLCPPILPLKWRGLFCAIVCWNYITFDFIGAHSEEIALTFRRD